MIRAVFCALFLAGCATGCETPAGTAAPGPRATLIEEHTHVEAIGNPCREECFPGVCLVAYGLSEQEKIACDAQPASNALCICQAP